MTVEPKLQSSDRRALAHARLYGIIDLGYVAPTKAVAVAAELIDGGVGIIQLRAKDASLPDIETLARELLPVTVGAGVPLIINDYPEIAAAVGCTGVHLGQDDGSIARAREIVGAAGVVGRSTHNLAQAVAAELEGADYIGFGPLFATPTKPGRPAIGLSDIAAMHLGVGIPSFCIGGIKQTNLDAVIAAGARRLVIVSELLLASDRTAYARTIRARLDDAAKARSDSRDSPA
jgi:thiamine-phosphate pyrophosphorylase